MIKLLLCLFYCLIFICIISPSTAVLISPLSANMVEKAEKFNNLGILTEFVGEA